MDGSIVVGLECCHHLVDESGFVVQVSEVLGDLEIGVLVQEVVEELDAGLVGSDLGEHLADLLELFLFLRVLGFLGTGDPETVEMTELMIYYPEMNSSGMLVSAMAFSYEFQIFSPALLAISVKSFLIASNPWSSGFTLPLDSVQYSCIFKKSSFKFAS